MTGCPRGPELIQALEDETITVDIIDELLVCHHIEFLKEQAERCARRQSLEIQTVALTFPNYLGRRTQGRSRDRFFEMYTNYLEARVRSVWGENMHYETGSERTGYSCVYL